MKLPKEYLSYIECGGIRSGRLQSRPGCFQLWTPKDIASDIEDRFSSRVRGFVGFGNSGDGEMLAFEASGAVYVLPLVGTNGFDAKKIASNWSEFVAMIRK
jgi:hypothetical protein